MQRSSENLQIMVANWLKDRPTMEENNNFHMVVQYLLTEVTELVDAYKTGDNKEIAQELSDIFIFSYTLATLIGVNIDSEVREKLAYNYLRYPAKEFQGGSYSEAKARCKAEERVIKEEFYK